MKTLSLTAASLAIVTAASAAFAAKLEPADKVRYEITIENTSAQVITPPVIAAHEGRVSIFEPWAPATNALAIQAETGNAAPLAEMLEQTRGVDQVIVGPGPILPGESATFLLSTRAQFVSATGMFATTNDAFFGLNGVDLPRRETTLMAPIYDAGTEANNELCAFIPGPPCAGDSGNERIAEGAEGIVAPHVGLTGQGDLDVALNWNDAPVHITIMPVSAARAAAIINQGQ